jgi:hypothetical protein
MPEQGLERCGNQAVLWIKSKRMSDNLLQEAQGMPTCVAVVLCNDVIEDKRTNNKTLVGLFNRIITFHQPASFARMIIMASLTNGVGTWPISFSIRAPSGKEVFHAHGKEDFSSADEVKDLVIELLGLPLPETGTYYIDIKVGETLKGERRFTVQHVGQEQT